MSEVPLDIAGTTCMQFSHLLVTLTWIELIEKDLSMLNIKLDIETNTAEKTMNSLGKLTASRKDWKRIVKDIMAENR